MAGLTLAFHSGQAQSKSSLIMPFPSEIGRVPALTYDSKGEPIGRSEFSLLPESNGRYVLRVIMRIEEGGESRVEAEFETAGGLSDGAPHLRLLSQQSQAFRPDGSPLTLLRIDHSAREASCSEPGDEPNERQVIQLPEDDRVANVPMHLFFLPIVRGDVNRISFQLFVCRGGPRLHDFVALGGRVIEGEGGRIVEVRYGPDLGKIMSWVASRLLPKLSVWFDANADGSYVGHRIPIYADGPDILVIREGIPPEAIGAPF